MAALDYILDGLEAELALERELGVRSVEIDRALLAPLAPPGGSSGSSEPRSSSGSSEPRSVPPPAAAPQRTTPPPLRPTNPPTLQPSNLSPLDFVFLHDKPLSAKGNEMMAKIIVALGKTAETAPIVVAPPIPAAKVCIVLGGLALRKWFPGRNVSPGQWFTDEKGRDVLVTYTPEYILRFGTVTPALKKIKQDMWNSLKSVLKRI